MRHAILAIILLAIFATPASAFLWDIETVESTNQAGLYTSVAFNSSDYPAISYQTSPAFDLKYAAYNGVSWEIETVDSDGVVGQYTSLAFNSSDHPGISYYDQSNGDLKYAIYNGASWNIETVDSAGNVGQYATSLVFNSSDHPAISYYDVNNTDVKYAFYNGSGWEIETVDSTGNVGYFLSLVMNSSDHPAISYYDWTNGDLKYASYNGSGWEIETVDSTGQVGEYNSLALNSSDYPSISYYYNNAGDLKYASYNGSGWEIETVDSTGQVGLHTSIDFDSSDYPVISYQDGSPNNDLKCAYYDGSGWIIEIVDSIGSVGMYGSLALNSSDYPVISYYDSGTNQDLKVAVAYFLATSVNASYTSVTYDENDNMTIDQGIVVNGSSTFTSARVYIGDGYVENEDFLRFTNTSSINGSFSSLTGILSLSGSGNAADYQEAFRNVRYENINDTPDTSDRNITFVMGSNTLYLESTGHYYESVYNVSSISWTDAKDAAEARSLSGMQGYLATILTEDESAFLESKAPDNAWIGANDAAVEGEWRWVTGPENVTGEGTLFYYQGNSTTLPGFYTNWNTGEPNDSGGTEEYAQILGAGNKMWNDLPDVGGVSYYLVEYGGMPNETAPQLTATITVSINSINDAPSMPGNFTSPLEGDSVERGSTINVSWGESTDVENDSLVYDLWYFNGTWTQIADMLNVASFNFTIPIDDVSGAMFKVYANDSVDNSSENNVTFDLTSFVPVTNFTADVTSGIVPITVNFTDLSSNHSTGWLWDFGDGNTSTDQNPTHIYTTGGTYNVSLNASNLAGSNVSTQLSYITAYSVPGSNFSANVTEGAVPLTVGFTDLSTNTPTSWYWDFGDGNNSTSQDPIHTYVTAGTYNVSLNATNIAGSDVTIQIAYISVYITPVANFSASVTSGTAPLSVTFTDLSSNTPTSWLWEFGDGSNSTSQNPTHSYTVAGSYNVTLNATNAAGSNASTRTAYINVSAASSSSGSDDGSSHRTSVGPSMEPDTVSSSDTSVKYVMGGTAVEFDLSDGNGPVIAISFDSKDNEGLVVTKVQVLKERPSDVPVPQGSSYSLMSIDVGAVGTISEDNADNLRIRFKVSREWIEENNIDVSTIRMTRYHGEQWNDLPTYQEREENGYIYFYAETPGFSIFEIVGDEISEATEQVPVPSSLDEEEVGPVEEETPDTPGFTVIAGIVFVSLAVLVRRK
ncbi:PKD domain-containing protein [Methanolobus profundi]|uniref:PGF-pre-PGF domain-containing protein n=1 Tax=Methanolobus profundi TaxID=487685 RepID=A0A1I4Q023_9EURY|nr:PKD domain-containing protein [Methanolobus profundi]SFM33040.1 PGF-pre-PGF domain-containing protein [Methanolobus profundi]